MGWISGAACALIAVIFLYRLSTRSPNLSASALEHKSTNQNSHQPNGTAQTKEQTAFRSPSFAVTAPEPDPGVTVDSTADQVQGQSETTARSTKALNMPPPPPPPPSQPVTSSPSMSMPPPRPKSPPRLKPPTFGPTPPRPGGGSLRPPPSAAASLRVPQQKVLQNTSMQPSALMPPPNKPSRQVVLEPGHSPLDWAALTSNPNNHLRGKDLPDHLIRVTPSQLKAQNGRKGKDAWTVYQGKVYNITPYVPFHPGGKGEILRGAAKDSVKLFMEVHPWVNWDGMLGECLVGILVGEEDAKEANKLDEMD